MTTQPNMQTFQINPQTAIGTATLAVASLTRSLNFYQNTLGLQLLESTDKRAVVGAGGQPLLILNEKQGAVPQPDYATGLYHIAILLPTRADLARLLTHIARVQYPMQGYADHLVSEAFYLADPDGNGLELYQDRPRDQWKFNGTQVEMSNAPIDLDNFFAEAGANPTWDGMPAGTKIGHMHLRVSNIDETKAFYNTLLGFDVVAVWNGALFVSAGGYHHHLGLNTWHSRGAQPAPANAVGLEEYSIVLPNAAAIAELVTRLEQSPFIYSTVGNDVIVHDPSQNKIRLTYTH